MHQIISTNGNSIDVLADDRIAVEVQPTKPTPKDETVERLIGIASRSSYAAKELINLELSGPYAVIRDAMRWHLEKLPGDEFGLDEQNLKRFIEQDRRPKSPREFVGIVATLSRCRMKTATAKPTEVPGLVEQFKREQFRTRCIAAAKNGEHQLAVELGRNAGIDERKLGKLTGAAEKTAAKDHRQQVTLVSFDRIKPEPVQWLWKDRVPLGKVTLFAGEGGCNKSTVAYDLAARVSAGLPAPLSSQAMPRGKALIVAGDDDPATDIRPRLDVMDADISRVYMMDIREQTKDGPRPRTFNLADLAAMRSAMEQDREICAVIIDPVSAFIGKRDANKHSDVYELVAPLNKLAAEFGVAVVLVAHTNKGGKGVNDFRSRINGSSAWTDATRSGFMFTKDRNDEDRRFMTHGKINARKLGKGIAFRVVEVPHAEVGSAIRIDWEGEVELTAEQALQHAADGDAEKLREAVEFLRSYDGWVSSDQLKADAKQSGIAERTLWRAKEQLGIRTRRRGFGRGGVMGWDCGGGADDEISANDDRPF